MTTTEITTILTAILGRAAPGAVYTSLRRLEDGGAVMRVAGSPTGRRGGKAQHRYSITKAGRAILSDLSEQSDLIRSLSKPSRSSFHRRIPKRTPKN